MKSRIHHLSIGAGALALFALAACQNQESPTQSGDVENNVPAIQTPGEVGMPAGRKATDEEVARFLAARKDIPEVDLGKDQAPLSKAAALATCVVDFNNQNSLAAMPYQANQGLARNPWYKHPCNGSYTVFSEPIGYTMFNLIPENNQWCAGPGIMMGYKSGAYCVNHIEAKLWPRYARPIDKTNSIRFTVKNSVGTYKYFDLKAIYMRSGTAEILAYRPGIGWWLWYPLSSPGRWTWPAGTIVSEIQVYDQGKDGYIGFDNLEIGINP